MSRRNTKIVGGVARKSSGHSRSATKKYNAAARTISELKRANQTPRQQAS